MRENVFIHVLCVCFCCNKVSFFSVFLSNATDKKKKQKQKFFFGSFFSRFFFVNKMTGTISAMFSNGDQHVILKIWAKNGAIFQERFQIEQTTFARVKYLAMRVLLTSYSWAVDEAENYKLISIETKRMIDEEKTLSQEEVKDGG
jgi:hypothetical protein